MTSINAPIKTFADFFCGVGGFHLAASSLGLKCVFASDINQNARKVYASNFGIIPKGDISQISASSVPDHDIFFAGFPCQPFSIIGNRKGFSDSRNGSLFFEAARVINEKRPRAIMLENVRQLATANKGEILNEIINTLKNIGYNVNWRILNALNFGLPQKRERILIVAMLNSFKNFQWPEKNIKMQTLKNLLEKNPKQKYFVSSRIKVARLEKHIAKIQPAIWHENKGGNIASHPFSCALRAGASHNYLLVDGKRRLTPREMFRLQGFPESFRLDQTDAQARKQAGNAVPVPMIKETIKGVCQCLQKNRDYEDKIQHIKTNGSLVLYLMKFYSKLVNKLPIVSRLVMSI